MKVSGISSQEKDLMLDSGIEASESSKNVLSEKCIENKSLSFPLNNSKEIVSPVRHIRTETSVLSREVFNKKLNFDWGKLPLAVQNNSSGAPIKAAAHLESHSKELKMSQENLSPTFSLKKYLYSKQEPSNKKNPKTLFECLSKTSNEFKALKGKLSSPVRLPYDTLSRLSSPQRSEVKPLDLKEALAKLSPKLIRHKNNR